MLESIKAIRNIGCALALSAVVLCGALTSVALAASPPAAATYSPSEVTSTTAKLGGAVDPNGQSTNYYFEYGTTSGYGSITPLTPTGSGTQSLRVYAHISGLAAVSTYHYRLVASNASGVTAGLDHSFTTAKIPFSFALAVPATELFGSPVTISGVLSGTGNASHPVVLQANPFPYLAGFKQIGNPELTTATGFFAFPGLTLPANTQIRVETLEKSPVISDLALAQVAVRVTLHVHPAGAGYARFYGAVLPVQGLARVYFQLIRPGQSPRTLSSEVIGGGVGASHFNHRVRIRHAGLYRAFVQVSSGEVVSNHSHPILIR